ncbi:MAG: two component transcriptional regulator, winged helix family [Thermoleophilia bacterium]|nr:two component transcriptional regulator, winged helix family [Thermoleophilia bacterium]
MNILIADDDRSIRDALRRALVLAGYDVAVALDGQEALDQLDRVRPDALILDIGMPQVDGLEVARRMRAAGDRTPILMLTARTEVGDRIEGLDAGADDYLAKPFDVGELKARIRAMLRRVEDVDIEDPNGARQADPTFAELRLDSGRHGVLVNAENFVELTRTEYLLLELLMEHPRQVLTHDVIYDRVWGYDFGPTSNALRVYVGYLRRKLDEAGASQLLHTIRGVGYVLREA